jgi:hypothetical protein
MPKGKRHVPSATLDEPDDKEIEDLKLLTKRVYRRRGRAHRYQRFSSGKTLCSLFTPFA